MPVAPTLSGSFEAVRVLSGGFSGQDSAATEGKVSSHSTGIERGGQSKPKGSESANCRLRQPGT